MIESLDTAPLRGQSLRGRPVRETCMPVNQGNQPLLRRRGGGGLATALPSGSFNFRNDNRWLERTTPSARAKVASQLSLDPRSHPSFAKDGSFACTHGGKRE